MRKVIFLGIFGLLVEFFLLGSVLAVTCPSGTLDYSNNSTNGTTYAINSAVSDWYINKSSTSSQEACSFSSDCRSFVCAGNSWSQDCTDDFEAFYVARLQFIGLTTATSLQEYPQTYESVGAIQERIVTLEGANCTLPSTSLASDGIDCRLGRETLKSAALCNVCGEYDSDYVDPNPISKECPSGYSEATGIVGIGEIDCCKPQVQCDIEPVGGVCDNHYVLDKDECCLCPSPAKNDAAKGCCIDKGQCSTLDGTDACLVTDPQYGSVSIPLCDPESTDLLCVETTNYSSCDNADDYEWVSADDVQSSDSCIICADGTTYGVGACLDGNGDEVGGATQTAERCPTVSLDPDDESNSSSNQACSKGAIVDGESCCEGYKKEGKVCKDCDDPDVCCGVELNTTVPFIGDCIQFKQGSSDENTTVVGPTTAFPKLMQGLSKLLVTAILVFSFVLLIVAGVMMTAAGGDEGQFGKGKQLIMKVIVGIALLGASGVILKLINPNFFG